MDAVGSVWLFKDTRWRIRVVEGRRFDTYIGYKTKLVASRTTNFIQDIVSESVRFETSSPNFTKTSSSPNFPRPHRRTSAIAKSSPNLIFAFLQWGAYITITPASLHTIVGVAEITVLSWSFWRKNQVLIPLRCWDMAKNLGCNIVKLYHFYYMKLAEFFCYTLTTKTWISWDLLGQFLPNKDH